jgi:tripartite-type tricarboxylate transporter receptor subunit TctC
MTVPFSFARRRVLTAASAATVALLSLPKASMAAKPYPERVVRVIVPNSAGGGADTIARLLFAKLGQDMNGTFIIDDRGGGGGTIGAYAAARAPNDGYNLLYDSTSHSVNPSLFKKLPFDTEKDFLPVFLAARLPNLLVVHPSVNVKTVADIVALAKATPGGLDWASSGNGGVQHLSMEMLKQRAGIKLNHVPYKGGGPALIDVLSGQVKFYFSNAAASTNYVKVGALKAIAHTGEGRLPEFPDLPPVADTFPGFEAYEWNGVFVPKGTSPEIITRLNAALNAVVRDPTVKERLAALSVQVRENTPAEFGLYEANEEKKWGEVVRAANIKLE